MSVALDHLLSARLDASRAYYEAEADRLARLCHTMAERFAAGGRLLAFGATPQGRSDARHVAVEFVHPVIVGKRALPAIAITREGGNLVRETDLIATPGDIFIAHDRDADTRAAAALARDRGCLEIDVDPGEDLDPFVAQEIAETAYHILWELCHVFLDRELRQDHDTGASSFLYPFLNAQEDDVEAVVADVRASILLKAEEIDALRTQTLTDGHAELVAAAAALRACLDRSGKVLALGNGGSATDAMDAVADLRSPPHGWPPRRALDLTEDTAIITAVANDIGPAAIFQRQVIAYGAVGDALLALSTSGGSENVIEALAEARRRGLVTVAFVGYDGGRIAADALADHVIVSRSENIPRIQEAQASAWHVLRELIESASGSA